MTAQGFILQTRRGETLTVVVAPETRLPDNAHFSAGDSVVVFGAQQDNMLTVHAKGIKKVEE